MTKKSYYFATWDDRLYALFCWFDFFMPIWTSRINILGEKFNKWVILFEIESLGGLLPAIKVDGINCTTSRGFFVFWTFLNTLLLQKAYQILTGRLFEVSKALIIEICM